MRATGWTRRGRGKPRRVRPGGMWSANMWSANERINVSVWLPRKRHVGARRSTRRLKSSMRGEWERKAATLWTYRLAGSARPYGYVVQYKDTARSAADWDATVTAVRLDDELTIAERVSFDEARTAIEQHAARHADRV